MTLINRPIALGIVLVLLVLLTITHLPKKQAAIPLQTNTSHTLLLNGTPFNVNTASTDAQRQQGLSGREPLPSRGGMLFVYDDPARLCFWMKDMRFSLDMIWLDENRIVTHIEQAVTPESYPTTYCADGEYVLEVSAGTVQSIPVNLGDAVDF